MHNKTFQYIYSKTIDVQIRKESLKIFKHKKFYSNQI